MTLAKEVPFLFFNYSKYSRRNSIDNFDPSTRDGLCGWCVCNFGNKNITVRNYDFPDPQMAVLTPLSRVCSPISSTGHGKCWIVHPYFLLGLVRGPAWVCSSSPEWCWLIRKGLGCWYRSPPASPFNVHTWASTEGDLCSCQHRHS